MVDKSYITSFIVCAFLLVIGNIFAFDFTTDTSLYLANREKIKSLSLKGSTNVNMKIKLNTEAPDQIKELNKVFTIEFYSKNTDRIRITLSSEDESIGLLQYGAKKYFKSSLSSGVNVLSSGCECEEYQIYFLVGFESLNSNMIVLSQAAILENGLTAHRYSIQYSLPVSSGCDIDEPVLIDRSDLFFDENGMLIKKIGFSGGVMKRELQISYRLLNGIYIPSSIILKRFKNGKISESSITYTDIEVNIPIKETIFQL